MLHLTCTCKRYHQIVVYLQKPVVGGKRNTSVLNKVSLLYCGVQREYGTKSPTPNTRTNSYQSSKWSPRMPAFRCQEHGRRRTTSASPDELFCASWGQTALKMSSLFANRCPSIGCFSSGSTTSSRGLRSGE